MVPTLLFFKILYLLSLSVISVLSWQKVCEKYVDILSSVPIAPTHKCMFLLVLCISRYEQTVFLVLVISV